MMKRLVFLFAVLAMAVASARTYSLTLFQPSVLNGTELKPGDYKLEVQDQKIVIRSGAQTAEASVKAETNGEKYRATSVRYSSENGKSRISEIRLGGTRLKLLLNN